MEEKVLIQSTHYSLRGKFKLIFIIMMILSLIIAAINVYDNLSWSLKRAKDDYITATTELSRYNYDEVLCDKHMDSLLSETTYIDELQQKTKEIHPNYILYAFCNGLRFFDDLILLGLIPYGIFLIILLF